MRIYLDKQNICDLLLSIVSITQVMLFLINYAMMSDNINLVIFYTNYIIITLIIVTLFSKNLSTHFLAITFYICFFIFLMGQKIFKEEKNVFLTFVRAELGTEQYYSFLLIIFIGIVVSYYAYIISANKYDYSINDSIVKKVYNSRSILPIIRVLYFVTLPFALFMQLKIVAVRSSIEYTSGYLMNVPIPTFIKIAYYLFCGFSLFYLAIKPRKSETFFVLGMMLFMEGGIQLIQGRRALFATTLFFIIWYLLKYYKIKKINIKYIIGLGIVGLSLVILFFFVEMNRSGLSAGGAKIGYIIKSFMTSTGGSDSVIANTILNMDNFPEPGIVYLIDPIIHNPIVVLLSGNSGINQGPSYLQAFNSFSHWISYLTNAQLYNTGHGMGSCYLAEAYLALGMIGVLLVSIVVGKALNYFARISFNGSFFTNAIVFICVKSLYTLPRDGLFSWFGDVTYLFISFCLIYPFYSKYCNTWLEVYSESE